MESKTMAVPRLLLTATLLVVAMIYSTIAVANGDIRTLSKSDFTSLKNNKTQVVLDFTKPLNKNEIRTFTLKDPARIVIDFNNTSNSLKQTTQSVNLGNVSRFTAVQSGTRTRAIVDLKHSTGYVTSIKDKQFTITVDAAKQSTKVTHNGPSNKQKSASSSTRDSIKNIDFRTGANGSGKIIFDVSNPKVNVDLHNENNHLAINFLNTHLPARLANNYDVTDFKTPVKSFTAGQQGRNAKITLDVKGQFTQSAYQTGNKYIVEVKPKLDVGKIKAASSTQKHYTGERLSLNFQDIPVRSVLQLLADFTGLNLVASDAVQGSVTLHLNNVPWDQALDIILRTRGLAKRQYGNVILVAPAKDIAAYEKQELASNKEIQELAPLHSELVQINYATAEDIASLLKDKNNSLLSKRGNVSVDRRTNTLWVQDTSENLKQIRSLVKRLDIPVKQVLIEARIVNVDKSFERDLGVKFGLSRKDHLSGTLDGANEIAKGSPISNVPVDNRLNFNLPVDKPGAGSIGLALVNIGGGFLLDLELSALESEGGGEIISSPRLLTSNQKQAVIEAGKEIPYQEATSSGATSVVFKKAVLKLLVTPQITPDNKIFLKLAVNQDKKNKSEEVLNVPVIDTNHIETSVLVNNGDTIVLGGIYERTKNDKVERIPFFGSLPVIGYLFRNTYVERKQSELLIFITPRIVENLQS